MTEKDERAYKMTASLREQDAARAYDVHVQSGVLESAGQLIAEIVPAKRYGIVTDTQVARLYAKRLLESFAAAGLSVSVHTFAAGEWNKSRESWGELTDEVLRVGFRGDAAIIALGGGVAADLGGFLAATLLPGAPLVLMPSTLLAMLECPLRGRAAIDTLVGRDRVGAVHSPRLVLIDPLLLKTLPEAHIVAGLAAAFRHAIVGDAEHFEWLAGKAAPVLARDPLTLGRLIARSLEIQTSLLGGSGAAESSDRGVLEFGDTVASALGMLSGYNWLHGERLAVGLALEAAIGELAGISRPGVAHRIRGVLEDNRLPTQLDEEIEPARFLEALAVETGALRGEVPFTLIEEIGSVAARPEGGWKHFVSQETVRAALFGEGSSGV